MAIVTGWRRALLRAPNVAYRVGLGVAVPKRFLHLRHIGRHSGRPRDAVLEVVDHDPVTGIYHVAAGFGPDSQWYRNLARNPEAQIQVGRHKGMARATLLDAAESGEMMVRYAARHPKAARGIMSMVGIETDGSEESYREIGRRRVPFVRFDPLDHADRPGVVGAAPAEGAAGLGAGSLAGLARLRDFERQRLSSYDRSGGNRDCLILDPDSTTVFGEIAGAGCVKHIWATLMALPEDAAPAVRREVVVRVYWDGESTPSVDVPIGDFFGVGFGLHRNFTSLPLQMSPEDGRGMNCWFPMPFAEGARFEVINESTSPVIFFFYVDYEQYPTAQVSAMGELARFHAHYRHVPRSAGVAAEQGWTRDDYGYSEEKPAGPGFALGGDRAPWRHPNVTGEDNYVILDQHGEGQYVGCVLNIDVTDRQVNDWYGEGDDMIFIDGESWPPRLHGTGTEDYFNTAFCPTQEVCTPYHGITVYSGTPEWPWGGKNSMYRFHIEDPIRFRSSIRVTIETGHANALANDYSSVAYWYQRGRVAALPAIPGRSVRISP